MKLTKIKKIALALAALTTLTAAGAGAKSIVKDAAEMVEDENARVLNVMAKIRRGEEVHIAAFGGSITTGYNSSNLNEKSWRALVGQWWKEKAAEYGADLKYLHEGVSGTDSAYGAARAQFHLIENKVDLVFLEFAMNDQWLEAGVRNRSYEGLIRQIENNSESGIFALFVNERNSPQPSQQKEQQPICEYYHIPFVSWKDCEIKEKGDSLDWNLYFDGTESIHPNDAGHGEIAKFIIQKLESIWALLPENDADLPEIQKSLPSPLTDRGYEFLSFYNCDNLKPVKNTGWSNGSPVHPEWVAHGNSSEGWRATEEGAEIVFKVKGTSVNILFAESDGFRNCQAWVKYGGKESKKFTLKCENSIRQGYLGWSSKELVKTDKETTFAVHIIVPKGRANYKGRETNICGIIVTHEDASKKKD